MNGNASFPLYFPGIMFIIFVACLMAKYQHDHGICFSVRYAQDICIIIFQCALTRLFPDWYLAGLDAMEDLLVCRKDQMLQPKSFLSQLQRNWHASDPALSRNARNAARMSLCWRDLSPNVQLYLVAQGWWASENVLMECTGGLLRSAMTHLGRHIVVTPLGSTGLQAELAQMVEVSAEVEMQVTLE
jgi:hypothetical protein